MAKKAKDKSPRRMPEYRGGSAIKQEEAPWREPTPHFLELDKARLAHWKAVISGNASRSAKTLKAWAALLHVPRTKGIA